MLEKILIISFIVFAIWYSMLEGEIFGSLGNWFEKHLPKAIHKPVFDCPVCMQMWYGTFIYWIVYSNNWQEWLIVVIAGMGLNCIITRLWPEK